MTRLEDRGATDDGSGDPGHLQRALHAAVRIGHDTDTVAAIAGALIGARYGASAISVAWRRVVHGWPGACARDLIGLAYRTAVKGVDPADHVECWIIDSADPAANAHLEFALRGAADTIAALRAEGRRVLLHDGLLWETAMTMS